MDGTEYVTARGWEDLSMAIIAYEQKGYVVNETLKMEVREAVSMWDLDLSD